MSPFLVGLLTLDCNCKAPWHSLCAVLLADPLAGGAQPTCGTTGNQLLDYYGYTINTAILIAAMLAAYIIFHLGSYLSLSRLYKKR